MKKLYTIALAAAMAFGASAAAPQVQTTIAPLPAKAVKNITLAEGAVVGAEKATFPTIRKAVSAEQLFGTYIWNYFCPLGQGTDEKDELEFSAGSNPNEVLVSGITGGVTVVGTADFNAGTVTMEAQLLVENTQVNTGTGTVAANIYFFPCYVDDNDQPQITEEAAVITITATGAEMDEMKGFCVAAVSLDGSQLYGYFNLCLFNEFVKYIESDYWTNIGDAEFKAGFIYAMFVGGEGLSTIETIPSANVPAQRSVEDPNIIRIKNAFAAPLEDDRLTDPITFDLTDRKCVVVPMQYTGITEREMGAVYILSRADNYESIDQFLASDNAKYALTVDNNVITIPAGGMWWYFPETDRESLYGAKNELPSSLTLPAGWDAIDNITVEGVDAPVEYYNLQGIRVANPENGLYIRRQGKNATKVLVK